MSSQGPFNHIGTREVDEAFHRLTVAQRDAAWFSLACLRAETATLEAEITRDHACIAAMREQLALRDARIAELEQAVQYMLNDTRPIFTPGSVSISNYAITRLKNAMYVGAAPSCERGQR